MAVSGEFKYRITAQDKTKKGVQSAQKNADKLSGGMKSLSGVAMKMGGAFAAAFSVKIIKDFTKESLKSWGQQERAMNKLTLAVENSPLLTGEAVGKMADYASELQKVTTVGDETTIAMQSMLASMDLTTDQINNTILAAANMSAAMDVDMVQAVRQLSKSYGGLQGELGELIPDIRELTKEQLESGEAIDLVNEKYAGMAEQLRGDTLGGMTAFGNAWGDLMEQVGRSTSRVLDPVIERLTGIAEAIGGILTKANDQKEAWVAYADAYNSFLDSQELSANMTAQNLEKVLQTARAEMEASQSADVYGEGNPQLAAFIEKLEHQLVVENRTNAARKQAQTYLDGLIAKGEEFADTTQVANVYATEFSEWLSKWRAEADPVAVKLEELQANLARAQANLIAAQKEGSNYSDQEISRLQTISDYLREQIQLIQDRNKEEGKAPVVSGEAGLRSATRGVQPEQPTGIMAIFGQIKNAFSPLIGMIAELENVTKLMAPVQTILEGVMDVLGPLINDMLAPLVGILKIVGQTIGQLLTPALLILNPVIEMLAKMFVAFYNKLVRPIVNGVFTVFNKLYNGIVNFINWIIGAINKIPGVSIGKVSKRDSDAGHVDKITFDTLQEEGGTSASETGGKAAQYTQGRKIIVENFEINTDVITGEDGGFRQLVRMIVAEMDAVEALGG